MATGHLSRSEIWSSTFLAMYLPSLERDFPGRL
jgi:hypothetical protein